MRQYRYRPLEPGIGHIRLLRIEKPQENDQPPVLHLRHARLEDEAFNALSYAWGAESPTHEIVIRDGNQQRTLSVRQNLYEFLKIAPTIAEDWSSQWIWIDQICINQNNTQERSYLVAQMGTLYSTAQATIIWPGRLDVSGDYDLEGHEPELSSPLYTPEDIEMILTERKSESNAGLDLRGDTQGLRCLFDTLTGTTLLRLMLQRYWSRLWVIQEIVLAARVRIIIAGSTYAFEDLATALYIVFYGRLPAILCLVGIYPLLMEIHLATARIAAYLRSRFKIQQNQGFARPEVYTSIESWETVLRLNTFTECTTQHDRVYALMGLLPESLHVAPDYDIPHRQLLKAVLEKEMTHLAGISSSRIGYSLGKILAFWTEWMNFNPIGPKGYVRLSPDDIFGCYFLGWKADSAIRMDTERNVRLVLEDLGLSIPSGLTID